MTSKDNAHLAKVSHVGLCVADIDRSLRFYCDGLGFVKGISMPLCGTETQKLIGTTETLDGKNQFIRLGAVAIELIQFQSPQSMPSVVPRPMNQIGFTHLSLRVADVDATAAKLEQLGGEIICSTRISFAEAGIKGEIVFCIDPDGTRVELMSFPDEVQFY